MRRITVCQDDAGLAPGVSAATLELAAQGRLGAVSCLAAAPGWREAAAALRPLAAQLDVGLHLDLTEHLAQPQLRRPLAFWLAGGGMLPGMRQRLRQEVELQLARFEDAIGRAPAHVDGHRHVHQCPGVRDAVMEVLAARGAGARPWIRSTRRAPECAVAPRKAELIARLGDAGLRRLAIDKGFRQHGHLLGVYGFDAHADGYLALLRDWLAACADGDVLMCHPATAPATGDPIAQARIEEFRALRSEAFGRLLREFGVQVLPLSRIAGAG